jgi:uncharacterized membrane protein YphA (DoxX/SURF4 family)
MSKNFSTKFSSWIFDSFQISARGLALYRILYALFVLCFMLPPPELYTFLGNLPGDFFAPPPGPMMFFGGFPPEAILLIFHYLLVAALLFLVAGLFTKWSSLGVGILLILLKGFIYSLGKIDHDIIIIVVPFVMAFSGWGMKYSLDSQRIDEDKIEQTSWPLTLLALFIGFMMFTAGFPKIIGGWLDINTHATQGYFFKQYIVQGRQDLLAIYGFNVADLFWELADYGTVLFEIGFLIAVVNPRSTRVFICLAVLFHLSTMLMLNIAFLPNFIAYAAFLNWDWINKKLKNSAQLSGYAVDKSVPVIMFLLAGSAFILLNYLDGYSTMQSDLELSSVLIIGFSTVLALYYLSKETKKLLG